MSSNQSSTASTLATVLAVGGIGAFSGFALARLMDQNGGKKNDSGDDDEARIERCLRAIDNQHAAMANMADSAGQEGTNDVAGREEAYEWACKFVGENNMPASLRIALRAQCVGRAGNNGLVSAVSLGGLLRQERIEEGVVCRVCQLVAKDPAVATHPEMIVLEDATCLAFFSRCPFTDATDPAEVVDSFSNVWGRMSKAAQVVVLGLQFTPKLYGCLLEAIATAEGRLSPDMILEGPRLPTSTVNFLKESWSKSPKDVFGEEFRIRLFAENPDMEAIFNNDVCSPNGIVQFLSLIVELLEPDAHSKARLEKVLCSAVVLARTYGGLRMQHMVSLKLALTRTIVTYTHGKERKQTNRAWEALFYSIAAVVGPQLCSSDSVLESIAASASPLPVPGGGTQAAIVAAQGVAVLEMCLSITAAQTEARKGDTVPKEVVAKLGEHRASLSAQVPAEVHAYCGLLGSIYACMEQPAGRDVKNEEDERQLWKRRSTEVPLRVAETSMAAAQLCVQYRKQIIRSLEGDWLAGAKLLKTAHDICVRNAGTNLETFWKDRKADSAVLSGPLFTVHNDLKNSSTQVFEELCLI